MNIGVWLRMMDIEAMDTGVMAAGLMANEVMTLDSSTPPILVSRDDFCQVG